MPPREPEQRGGEFRRRDTDPTGRRAEAAFEDTQAMLAAQAGGGSRSGEGGVRRRRAGRGASGPAGGPGGPEGPEGPGGPGGHGPGDGEDEDEPKRWTRFLPNWKIVMASFVVLSAGVFGMIAVAYANTPVPETAQAGVDDRGSVVYYRDKKTPIARLGVKRTPVEKLSQIPRHVQDAVIALENQSFRTDSGIDLAGMARSLWSTVSGAQLQGASTITQQMARGYYDGLSKEVSAQRKIKEIFVAVKISKTLEKDDILLRYFNLVYFGRGAYGIQAASKAFFNKNVGQLTPQEGAYLAGRIQNPNAFDVQEQAGNYAATKWRFGAALRNMAEMDPAAYGKYAGSSFDDLKFAKAKTAEIFKGIKGYMLNIVLRELKGRGITQEDLETKGYKVYTTFDKDMMKAAQEAVKGRTAGLEPTIHARVASVDPRNGRVLAFYSGDDFVNDFNNRAFDSTKQAASAFKPYVLAAWLESGRSLGSYVDGMATIKMPGTTPISNSGNTAYGAIDMVKAMASSVNTVFVQMGEAVTLPEVARIAKEAGVGETAKYNPAYGGKNAVDYAVDEQKYQVTIGSASVTAVEQAAGYSIFANEGKHADWHTVTKVTKVDGSLVLPEQATVRDVISPEAAADATVALQAVVKGGTGASANLGSRPVAGKTGTNNGYKDAWFVGFTPQLVTAVGMSKDVPYNRAGTRKLKVDKYGLPSRKIPDSKILWKEEPMPSFIGGGGTPTQIWHDYMAKVTAKDEVVQFPPRADTGSQSNLATPKPTPTAEPTMEGNPFPDDNGGGNWPNDGDGDPFPDDNGGGDGNWPNDVGNDGSGDGPPNGEITQNGAAGAAIMPTPAASGRRP